MNDVIINLPGETDLPQELLDQIKEGLRTSGLGDNVQVVFYGPTTPRTPPGMSLLFSRPVYTTINPPEVELRRALMRVKSVSLEDIPGDESMGHQGPKPTQLVPRAFNVSDKQCGEADLTEFRMGGIVYKRVKRGNKETERPDHDISLLPWIIEVNGVAFQRGPIQQGPKG